MAEPEIDKITTSVKTSLDEQSVNDALKDVQSALRDGQQVQRRASPPRPAPPVPAAPRSRIRNVVGQAVDVATTVGAAFRTRFERVRKLALGAVKDVTETFGRGLTNLAVGRRAASRSESPVLGAQPAPPALRRPEPRPAPIAPVLPLVIPDPLPPPVLIRPPVRIVLPPLRIVNNYETTVIIDPRQMKEWLDLLALLGSLRQASRAMPKPSKPKVYIWMSREEKRDLEKTTFTEKSLEEAGWQKSQAQAYISQQSARERAYAKLNKQLNQIVDAQYTFREERITRFKKPPGKKAPAELGPSGRPRQANQFYFNRRFQGATYSVPTMTRNRRLVAAARPEIERARRAQYDLAGKGLGVYRPFAAVSTAPVRVFYPSKWGRKAGGRPELRGSQQAVDLLTTRRLGISGRPDLRGLPDSLRARPTRSGTYNPLLKRLLQND